MIEPARTFTCAHCGGTFVSIHPEEMKDTPDCGCRRDRARADCYHPDHKPFVIRPSGEVLILEFDAGRLPAGAAQYQSVFIGEPPNRIQWTRKLDPGVW